MLAFVNIGLVPDGGASLFVPSRIGFARAAEMALLGEPVTAAKAVDIGLINAAWPDEEFAERADALLERLSNGPTRSYAGSKRELNHWLYSRMPEHLALEAKIQGELGGSQGLPTRASPPSWRSARPPSPASSPPPKINFKIIRPN